MIDDLMKEATRLFITAKLNKGSTNATYATSAYLLSKIIEEDPQRAIAYNNRGVIEILLKNYNSAITDLTQAIQIDSNYSYPYFNRGLAYDSLGETIKAIENYQLFSVADPDLADKLFQLDQIVTLWSQK